MGSHSRPTPKPVMRGIYFRGRWNALFQAMDGALSLAFPHRGGFRVPVPERILLANFAHLGDVLLSTAVLPVLRSAFPRARIGFLAGSWSRPILEGHHLVDWVHYVDHWKSNRVDRGIAAKILRHREMARKALREIRPARYDVAVDLYSYYPNSIPLLWRAGIPVRIGYTSGGFGPLLTHPIPFRQEGLHETGYQEILLRQLPIGEENFRALAPVLRSSPEGAREEVKSLLSLLGAEPKSYRILHLGSGAGPSREWPLESWRTLAERLAAAGHRMVMTGLGEREKSAVARVSAGLPEALDACNLLSWDGFVEMIREAEIVYSVETSAGHLAAALGTPVVSIYGGTSDIDRWRPRGRSCALVTRPLPCSPCHVREGCEGMECLGEITPEEVLASGEDLLRRRGSSR